MHVGHTALEIFRLEYLTGYSSLDVLCQRHLAWITSLETFQPVYWLNVFERYVAIIIFLNIIICSLFKARPQFRINPGQNWPIFRIPVPSKFSILSATKPGDLLSFA